MANRRALFAQADVTKVLKAFRDAGEPTPQIIIEPMRMTVSPMIDAPGKSPTNPWDE